MPVWLRIITCALWFFFLSMATGCIAGCKNGTIAKDDGSDANQIIEEPEMSPDHDAGIPQPDAEETSPDTFTNQEDGIPAEESNAGADGGDVGNESIESQCGNGDCEQGEDPGSCPQDCNSLKAFPTAEGFGAASVGGRGGTAYEVISLSDSGTGSLRSCVNATGPRICVFKVGGTILLETALSITNPYITIAGQTAPGGGIILRNQANSSDSLDISTHDVIIRYLTIRRGPPTSSAEVNSMAIYENDNDVVYNIVIDHCSLSWSNDRVLFTWYGARDYSLQWNIFSEALDCNRNPKGCHSKGVMLGSALAGEGSIQPGGREVSFHHNLIAHCADRTPLIKPAGIAEVVNNVTYNSHAAFSRVCMEDQLGAIPVNYVGNYFRTGPDTEADAYGIRVENVTATGAKIFTQGNIGPHRQNNSLPEIDFVQDDAQPYHVTVKNLPDSEYPITIHACESIDNCVAYDQVIANAGNFLGIDSNGNFYPRRDAVDRRVLEEVKRQEGKIIDAPGPSTCENPSSCRFLTSADYTKYGISDPLDADGWPVISGGISYPDTDHDGMPDDWENNHGFNPNLAADGSQDQDGDGYTNLEEFLNGSPP